MKPNIFRIAPTVSSYNFFDKDIKSLILFLFLVAFGTTQADDFISDVLSVLDSEIENTTSREQSNFSDNSYNNYNNFDATSNKLIFVNENKLYEQNICSAKLEYCESVYNLQSFQINNFPLSRPPPYFS